MIFPLSKAFQFFSDIASTVVCFLLMGGKEVLYTHLSVYYTCLVLLKEIEASGKSVFGRNTKELHIYEIEDYVMWIS